MTDAERAIARLKTETQALLGQEQVWRAIDDAASTVHPASVLYPADWQAWSGGSVRLYCFADGTSLGVLAPATTTMDRQVSAFDRNGVSSSCIRDEPAAVAALVRGEHACLSEERAHEMILAWLSAHGDLPHIPGVTRQHIARLLMSREHAVRLVAARLLAELEDE
jgi:hypothetical protein